ncbi:MAG: hypothetical protein ABI183_09215 [Polyangiaceae bacterium]
MTTLNSYLLRRTGDVVLYLALILAVPLVFLGPLYFFVLVAIFAIGKWNEVQIEIRSDGIRIREGLRKRHFFRYSEINDIDWYANRVEIEFRRYPTRTYRFGLNVAITNRLSLEQMAESLVDEVRQMCDAARLEASAMEIPWLHPAGKEPRQWLASLREIGTHERSCSDPFRGTRIPREALWKVFESPAVAIAQRIAATVALTVNRTKEDAARMQRVIENCADRALAHDLFVASQPNDDGAIEALERITFR